MTRLGALVAAGMLVLAGASATAGPAITTSVSAPHDGDVLAGTVDVQGTAHAAAGVKRIEISIDSFGVASKQFGGLQQDASATYSWDSNHGADSSSILPNGEHSISVHAVAVGGAEDTAKIEIQTDNPPVTPGGVTGTAGDGSVRLSWSPNPEPDILGYVIERDSGSGFVAVGAADDSQFAENLVAGSYSYRVIARRFSPNAEDGIASAPSEPVGVTVASAPGGDSGTVTKLTSPGRLGGSAHALKRSGAGAALAALLSGHAPAPARLPEVPSLDDVPWGTFDKDLPYRGGPAPVPPELRSRLVSTAGPGSVVPPDGLRWVAAGLLLLVCALLSRILATTPVRRRAVVGLGPLRGWFTAPARRRS